MLVVRSGDHDRVDVLLREQVVVVDIGFGRWRLLQGHLRVGFIDFGDGDTLRPELLKDTIQITAAPSGAY